MDNEKFDIKLPDGANRIEIIHREGEAVKELETKAPVKLEISGTIGAPLEYLKKRLGKGQFELKDSHMVVDRDNVSLTLVTNENDYYRKSTIEGRLQYDRIFLEFGINSEKSWTPSQLGLFCKMNRAFFSDRKDNMTLVSTLMNFTGDVNNRIEHSIKESGDRADSFAQIVNSNLPSSFSLQIPIFKGMAKESLEVETFASIDGREVRLSLISPGAMQALETMRDKVIDEELSQIKVVAPELAIIEI